MNSIRIAREKRNMWRVSDGILVHKAKPGRLPWSVVEGGVSH